MARKPSLKLRRCQVCRHPERLRIEMARLAGASLEATASKFGIHRDALWRHMQHLEPDRRAMLVADVPLKELAERAAAEGVSLLDYFAIIRKTVLEQMLAAASVNDRNGTANLARASTEVLREIGKLTGEILSSGPVTNITNNTAVLIASPFFQQLESMLVRRLQPYPEALRAVLDGLAEIEDGPDIMPAIEGSLVEVPHARAA